MAAFATLGYSIVTSADAEDGVEKIALFALNSLPTHAARQLSDGRWTSKLGREVDISHELKALEGVEYGQVVAILGRTRSA